MPYDGKLLARARSELDSIREKNREEQQRRYAAACAKIPELRQIDQQLRAHMAQLVRLTLSKRPDLKERLDELRDENLSLQMRRAERLTAAGFGGD